MDSLAAPERTRSGLSVVVERSQAAIELHGPRVAPLATTFAWVLIPALFALIFGAIDIICIANIISDPLPSGLGLAVCGPMLYWSLLLTVNSVNTREYVGARVSANGVKTTRRSAYQTFEERVPHHLLLSLCIIPTVRDRMLVAAIANTGTFHPIGVFTESEIAAIAAEMAALVHLPCFYGAVGQLPIESARPPFLAMTDAKQVGKSNPLGPVLLFDDTRRIAVRRRPPALEIPFEKTGPFKVDCLINGNFIPAADRESSCYDYSFRLSMCPRDSEPLVLAVCTSREKKATDHSSARENAEWIADFYRRLVVAASPVQLTTP